MATGPEAGLDAPPPVGLDPQQVQHMQAIMAMAGAMPPPPTVGDASSLGTMPQIDPTMIHAYMQMAQYLQQGLQQGAGLGGANTAPVPGSVPFGGMTNGLVYTNQTPVEPMVSVSVEGMKFQYQLTEDDLHKVFSRYGRVNKIKVDEAGSSAIIHFGTIQDAQAAMQDLNGKVLNGLEGTLRINFVHQPNAAAPPLSTPYPAMPFTPGWGFPPSAPGSTPWPGAVAPDAPATASIVPPPSGAGAAGGIVDSKSPHIKGVRKYTCRFLIGIENDKDFQVARRIIGAKGVNMKRIFKQTEAKLRLRGKGSGYFEGAGQKESSEPLQLCISCTSAEGYKNAVRQAEDLLKRLYDEYRTHCRNEGKPIPDLQINLSENQLVYSRGSGDKDGDDDGDSDDGVGPPGAGPEASPKGEKSKRERGRRARYKGEPKAPEGEVTRGEPGPNAPTVEEIEKLIDERNEARRACNFAEADRIRELLVSRGVALMDEPGGRGRGAEVTTWRYWRD